MRKLTRNEWIAVSAGIIIVIIFVLLGNPFGFFSSSPADTSTDSMTQSQDDMSQYAGEASSTPPASEVTTASTTASGTIAGVPVQATADGLQIQDVKAGTGVVAAPGDSVTVNYTGYFLDGTVFDSSIPRGQPFTFTLGQGDVIPGWDEGLVGMKAGGNRHLVIPSSLGYGPNDYGPIPGNSTLLFDVQLISVTPASAAGNAGATAQ